MLETTNRSGWNLCERPLPLRWCIRWHLPRARDEVTVVKWQRPSLRFLAGALMETVLIVDDSAVDRRLAGGLLSKLPQLHVEYSVDGLEAVERIEELNPDLVVTDLVMPGRNGLELVEEMQRRWPQLPVILMT